MGMPGVRSRSIPAKVWPSMSGMCMSVTTTSTGCTSSHASASAARSNSTRSMPQRLSCLSRIRKLTSVSSTTAARLPARLTICSEDSMAASGASVWPSRAVNQKVEPSPGADCSPTSPPISPASRLQMASPSPVPPYLRVVLASTWTKDWNRAVCRSGAMPMPVSLMRNSTSAPSWALKSSSTCAETTTWPFSVNLTALLTRLSSTWRSRVTSPRTQPGSSPPISTSSSSPFSRARGAPMSQASSIVPSRLSGSFSSSSLPDSILEKSRMSLITPSSWSLEIRMVWT